MSQHKPEKELSYTVPKLSGLEKIDRVMLNPQPPLSDYMEAMALANREAEDRQGECMLLSWYDRDRDFEAPQHSSECHLDNSTPGYVNYGMHHGATLIVDIELGRFVFFFLPVDPD